MADDAGGSDAPVVDTEDQNKDEGGEDNDDDAGSVDEEDVSEGDEEEHPEGEPAVTEKDRISIEDELWGEMEGEGEEEEGEEKLPEAVEEEGEVEAEELPPDPTAPYNLTDESEAQKAPFELRQDQLAECEELWALYLDFTPAYTDLQDYVTDKELVYMLQALNLQTFTPEQMYEMIDFCVRPPHPDGHITFPQFLWIITIRQRDMPIEEEIRLALQVMDPENTGLLDREYFREVLNTKGYKMKNLDAFIKEVDMTNDGTLGIEDIVGTMCIDLNRDDIIMLQNQINPPEEKTDNIDNLI